MTKNAYVSPEALFFSAFESADAFADSTTSIANFSQMEVGESSDDATEGF